MAHKQMLFHMKAYCNSLVIHKTTPYKNKILLNSNTLYIIAHASTLETDPIINISLEIMFPWLLNFITYGKINFEKKNVC